MITRALLVAAILGLCVTTAQAQVFPRIEKDDVKKRVASGSAEPEDQPETQPDEKPADVDGAKALARYNELLSGYLKDEKGQRKAMTRHTDQLHAGVRDYFEGVFLLRMGFYKDAERKLKDVGVSVRNEKDIGTPELLKAADDIKSGRAFYFRMIATIMQRFADFKTEQAAEDAWKEASRAGIEVRQELEKLVDRGKVSSEDNCTQEMTAWLLTARREWLNLYKAEKNLLEHPENQNTWLFLIAATGTKQEDKREYTPNFLKQRAALVVIKEFWPQSAWVKGGVVDAGLGQNHMATGQLDDIEKYFDKQPYHSVPGAVFLAKQREQMQEYLRQVEALKQD